MTGTVISESTKGFCFAEADATHQCVFIHICQVKGERCLHVGDRVSFELIPNPIRRGQQMGGHVEYLGHPIDQAVSR
jgi:cold shock CspA family protein